jgi:hypothetical protein
VSDPLSHRLPDLPNAGYATNLQRELSDAIMFLLRGIERDRMLLLEIVIAGQARWRKRFLAAYRAIKADTEFADAVYGYLVLLAGPNPEYQKTVLQGMERQQKQQAWDKRLSTVLKFSKDRKQLERDIQKELIQRKNHRVTFDLGH